ncbi:hypothetical protein UFOVP326_41 [uncultured Caudovirales phage]|uniref:Uncharacterized protein n=1 Tax=uncultured Caudovirales phage TaxID=2100421 RepID=A0A6J5LSZ6_9CAUD|nr:hypothetical protein UFOVP326_41 [uncultured Caudovirales phage]
MNLRTLKKRCKLARDILIRDHGYRPKDFTLADGDESIDAPTNMEARFQNYGFLDPGPLPGTPLLWRRTNYEADEWDYSLPCEHLADIIYIEHTNFGMGYMDTRDV